jgi:hypothetical protein
MKPPIFLKSESRTGIWLPMTSLQLQSDSGGTSTLLEESSVSSSGQQESQLLIELPEDPFTEEEKAASILPVFAPDSFNARFRPLPTPWTARPSFQSVQAEIQMPQRDTSPYQVAPVVCPKNSPGRRLAKGSAVAGRAESMPTVLSQPRVYGNALELLLPNFAPDTGRKLLDVLARLRLSGSPVTASSQPTAHQSEERKIARPRHRTRTLDSPQSLSSLTPLRLPRSDSGAFLVL